MSTNPQTPKRKTVPAIRAMKGGAHPIVCLTAYSAPIAAILDRHVDLLLVGDSIGMVLYGMESTLGVDLEMMIRHGRAVRRRAAQACVIVDMPFGSYQESPEMAFRNAARIMKETGCDGVKLEGGAEMAETIAFLTARGIPVMGHIGLAPQSFNLDGGFKVKGRESREAQKLTGDASAAAESGAFAIVIEGTVAPLAAEITRVVPVPTIGIGAAPECDGQILVSEDMLGMLPGPAPKFVTAYASLAAEIDRAAAGFAADVRARKFPKPANLYGAAKKSARTEAAKHDASDTNYKHARTSEIS